MSNNWINKFLGAPKGPNGLYSTPDLLGGVNDNKITTNFWPGGDFNNSSNPLSAIMDANGKMGKMSKNLMSNQTIMAQYIHIPRIILPLFIPRVAGHIGLIDLMKSTVSGDVVFNLRYNDEIMKAGLGSKIIRKEGGDSVFSVNLATLNYILMGIQGFLEKFRVHCTTKYEDDDEDFDELLKEAGNIPNRGANANNQISFDKFYMWLKIMTNDDFKNMMSDSFIKVWREKMKSCCIKGTPKDRKKIINQYYTQYICSILWDFINTYAKLGGVFVGSDNQGGNHQGMSNPCSFAPTDYVGVIQAAGKNMKVRNLWANCENGTSSGDIVGFRFMLFANCTETNIDFKLSSNVDTHCNEYINIKAHSTYVLLVPAKKNSPLSSHISEMKWVDANFLQFGICDQISKPSINSTTNLHHVSTNALFSGNPAPIQICLRFDFCRLSGFSYSNTLELKSSLIVIPYKRRFEHTSDTDEGKRLMKAMRLTPTDIQNIDAEQLKAIFQSTLEGSQISGEDFSLERTQRQSQPSKLITSDFPIDEIQKLDEKSSTQQDVESIQSTDISSSDVAMDESGKENAARKKRVRRTITEANTDKMPETDE